MHLDGRGDHAVIRYGVTDFDVGDQFWSICSRGISRAYACVPPQDRQVSKNDKFVVSLYRTFGVISYSTFLNNFLDGNLE